MDSIGKSDGLEWSIAKITGSTDLPAASAAMAHTIASVQKSTSFLPDYESTWSGIIGCGIVVALVWVVCAAFTKKKHTA